MIGARALRQCARCGAPIDPCSRADRRTCSTRCRVATRRATTARRQPTPARGDQDVAPAVIDTHQAG